MLPVSKLITLTLDSFSKI